MKVCFCSTFLVDEKYSIKNSKIAPNISTHKFNLNLLEGIKKNIGDDLSIFNTENIASYPRYNKIILKTFKNRNEIGEYFNIGKLNIPIIKDLIETVILYRKVKKWIVSQDDKEIYICGYGRRLSHVMAINMLKKKYKYIKTCMVLCDLSGDVACRTIKIKSLFKRKILDLMLDFQVQQCKKFDSFVFITKEIQNYLNVADKPNVVIEGIYSDKFENVILEKNIQKNKQKIIAYSGILSKEYNVDMLINAFLKIENKNYELWIFGDGELKEDIEKLCVENKKIKYFGFLPNELLRRKLLEATVLVNPRQNIGEFTKYSFPSKTIEYLSLGKVMIGYKLDGIPEEYDNYISYVTDNSEEKLKSKILEICEKTFTELNSLGEKNREFIRKSKNNKYQTKKIIRMFKNMKGITK